MIKTSAFMHTAFVVSAEIAYFFLSGLLYVVFSLLAFGEGANSFMYSIVNTIICLVVQGGIPTLVNTSMWFKYKDNNKNKRNSYAIAQAIIVGLFGWELVNIF